MITEIDNVENDNLDNFNSEERLIAVRLSVFEIDTSFFVRENLDEKRVSYFVSLLKNDEELPSLKVALSDGTYFCIDGHHVLKAYQEAGKSYVDCILVDIPVHFFKLFSVKFNLKSSKPLSVPEITRVIIDSVYSKKMQVSDVADILGVGLRYVNMLMQPYRKKKAEEELENVIQLHDKGDSAQLISEKTGLPIKRVQRWINQHVDPFAEDKKLLKFLRGNSETIFSDKEMISDSFLIMQSINRNENAELLAKQIKIQRKEIITVGYIILFCYQVDSNKKELFSTYFAEDKKDVFIMFQFLKDSFEKIFPERKSLFDWIQKNDDIHDDNLRKIFHSEMLHQIEIEESSEKIEDIEIPVKRGRKKISENYEINNIDTDIDFFNPHQLSKIVDKFKIIEEEVVVNKKTLDSQNAQKLLEQVNRLLIMINAIIPELSKSIKYK